MKKNNSIQAKVRSICALLALALGLAMAAFATQAQGSVVPPNGTLSADVVDLSVQGSGGAVQLKRTFNGAGWRFNRHWDGISASYKPVMTQNTGGGSPGASASGEPAVCWIWVDEDWQPGDGVAGLSGTTPSGPVSLSASSYQPANRSYSQSAMPLDQNISTGFASGCGSIGGNLTGGSSSIEVFEGWRRQSTLYVGSGGTYIFKNRYVLKKQPVQKLPAWSGEPAGGSVSLAALQAVASGWRWSERGGDWSEYDGEGRISRYGDKNDNTVWLQRNAAGQIVRILDAGAGAASARALITLHYDAQGFLVQAKDWPDSASALEPPQRVVSYSYDSLGRMTGVLDARGFATAYAYDSKARLVSTTDPRGGVTTLAYEGEGTSVARMSAADGGVTDYSSSWDDTKKLFYSKIQSPATSAGRRVEDYSHDRAGDLVRYEVNGRSELEIKRDPIARTETRTRWMSS